MEALVSRLGALTVSRPAAPAARNVKQGVALSQRAVFAATPVSLSSGRQAVPLAAQRARVARAVVAEAAAADAATGVEPEAKAVLNSLKGSVFKVRRVLDVIRGRDYEEALMILEFLPQRCTEPIQNLVLSCAANAKQQGMKKSKLFISEIMADQGPYLRRFQPRAQGRAYAIRKPTCSISIKMKSHETSKRARPPIKLGSN